MQGSHLEIQKSVRTELMRIGNGSISESCPSQYVGCGGHRAIAAVEHHTVVPFPNDG